MGGRRARGGSRYARTLTESDGSQNVLGKRGGYGRAAPLDGVCSPRLLELTIVHGADDGDARVVDPNAKNEDDSDPAADEQRKGGNVDLPGGVAEQLVEQRQLRLKRRVRDGNGRDLRLRSRCASRGDFRPDLYRAGCGTRETSQRTGVRLTRAAAKRSERRNDTVRWTRARRVETCACRTAPRHAL